MRHLSSSASVAIPIALSALLSAQAPELNVKLGLWEMTMTMEAAGIMPPVDVTKQTAHDQALAQAAIRAIAGMPAMTMKQCMTRENLQQNRYTADRPGTTCTSKVTKATSTTVDMTQACTGTNPSTNEIHVEATSPTKVKITGKQTSGQRGAPVTFTINGKWLSADCGDVK